ncbi:hypothetical protein ASG01_08960 [Chryseobacterium sp. Leaf180]|uniref:PD-(D/E)XK nuclease-like domain-containing protein n=1 Tax=Chryseobacterium sp. Leaf180 TaxID=1736289 RepID=UPI0006F85DB9|nr:PD-(D/E)XK nuclease-like domain-containing protein [Chryseobacterium sp. Leaf180]KQR93316.1 hypothetical protein ASG01_08960 [Chryseobacterium sp. Leaf180]
MSLTKQNIDYSNASMIQEESNPKYELIGKLLRRELRLSYSKLKHLSSPINFIDALLNPKQRNSGMTLGSIVDCLLLTEDKFDDKFTIVAIAPTTDKQHEFVNLVLDKMNLETFTHELFAAKFKEAIAEGFSRVKTEGLEHYIIALIKGKEVISQDHYDRAKRIVNNLKESDEVCDELMLVEDFQKKLEFTYKGWNFLCFLDTFHKNGFHDLKFASDCHPDKFERDLVKFGYDIQIGVYAIGFEIVYGNFNPNVKHIVFDAVGNYTVLEIDSAYVNYCKRKVDFLIHCLEKMIAEKGFNKSYNFFRSRNTIYKPKWAPGFDMAIFENDYDEGYRDRNED